MPLYSRITEEDLRECHTTFVMHIKLANGGYALQRRCVEHPSLLIVKGRDSRQAKPYCVYFVGDDECAELYDAAKLLTRERDDLEWEAAAPQSLQEARFS